MTKTTDTRNADSYAGEILPLDGPYTPEAMNVAGELLGELVRRLNHATLGHNTGQSLRYPSHLDRLVRQLNAAVDGMPQLLAQLANHLTRIQHDPRLRLDTLGRPIAPADSAAIAAMNLGAASGALNAAADLLRNVGRDTHRMAWFDPEEGDA